MLFQCAGNAAVHRSCAMKLFTEAGRMEFFYGNGSDGCFCSRAQDAGTGDAQSHSADAGVLRQILIHPSKVHVQVHSSVSTAAFTCRDERSIALRPLPYEFSPTLLYHYVWDSTAKPNRSRSFRNYSVQHHGVTVCEKHPLMLIFALLHLQFHIHSHY